MKNLLIISLFLFVFSCKNKDDVTPKSKTVPVTYGILRIELTAEKLSNPYNFTSIMEVSISPSNDQTLKTYTSLLGKSNSIIKEYSNVRSDAKCGIKGYSETCNIPMTIKVYYNGAIIKTVSKASTCGNNNFLNAGVMPSN